MVGWSPTTGFSWSSFGMGYQVGFTMHGSNFNAKTLDTSNNIFFQATREKCERKTNSALEKLHYLAG
jgi:hypothetical protein